MKCTIHFYQLNEDYSQEYADTHFSGKESEDNLKYEWEDEIAITSEVDNIKELRNAIFPLRGELSNGEFFQYEIHGMFLIEIESKGYPSLYIGCSESILADYKIEKGSEAYQIDIFLKDYEPMANPIPGVFIASKEFPKDLIDQH